MSQTDTDPAAVVEITAHASLRDIPAAGPDGIDSEVWGILMFLNPGLSRSALSWG